MMIVGIMLLVCSAISKKIPPLIVGMYAVKGLNDRHHKNSMATDLFADTAVIGEGADIGQAAQAA
jgi:hypothetical protein